MEPVTDHKFIKRMKRRKDRKIVLPKSFIDEHTAQPPDRYRGADRANCANCTLSITKDAELGVWRHEETGDHFCGA